MMKGKQGLEIHTDRMRKKINKLNIIIAVIEDLSQ